MAVGSSKVTLKILPEIRILRAKQKLSFLAGAQRHLLTAKNLL